MAEAASQNHISKEKIEAYLDRFEGLEEEAVKIMTDAMTECRNGPRAGQKDLRVEMRAAGVRMKTFNTMWQIRQEITKSERRVAALEDDDLDQLRECAQALSGTPFGDLLQARLDEPAF